jgi:hypothetical protein
MRHALWFVAGCTLIFMLAFALGQGVPFVLVGILVDRGRSLLRRIRRYTRLVSVIVGVTLMLVVYSSLLACTAMLSNRCTPDTPHHMLAAPLTSASAICTWCCTETTRYRR